MTEENNTDTKKEGVSTQEQQAEVSLCNNCVELEKQVNDLRESLMRVQADYANYRRRTENERIQIKQKASIDIVKDILPILDNFYLALNQAQNHGPLYKGMELIYSQLIDLLERHNVKRIPIDTYDPRLHEALLTEPSSEPKGTIIEELQPGYVIAGHVLRTAKVKVSAGKEQENE